MFLKINCNYIIPRQQIGNTFCIKPNKILYIYRSLILFKCLCLTNQIKRT